MTSTTLAAGHGTTYGPIIVTLGVVFIVGAVIAVVVASYFRLQGHRADAVANQQELRDQLTKLTEKVQAVEQLMRDVG